MDLTANNAAGAATIAVGVILLVFFIYAAVQSVAENEPRAGVRFLLFAVFAPLPYFVAGGLAFQSSIVFAVLLLALTGLVAVLFAIPTGTTARTGNDTPTTRIDERDTMFSRQHLEVGTTWFEQYYRDNPTRRAPDDAFRAEPGLLQRGARHYNPQTFCAADASFTTVEQLRPLVDGPVAQERVHYDPVGMTRFIKRWAVKLGARRAGVTELQDYHKYTVVGRGADYGQTVALDQKFAIAVTVEMDKRMLDSAPLGTIVMESSQQYLASGAIAIQIAEFIRGLGYPARAHIDGNYRVVCPLVARDAGLGEIGRMGLLMTPDLGPRVRIAVVTTDLPLVVDRRRYGMSMIDFCTDCKKCAEACPSRAISFEGRTVIDGAKRWQIDSEACFTLWCKLGTDCGRCVSVCPYSHPDNLLHRTVRFGVQRSRWFRKAALKLDDVFYGRTPPPDDLPGWMRLEGEAGSGEQVTVIS
ncbi:MAG: 4Fe-4S dicluster domain-containing protein [Gemmatimonadota bacterium]|nr:MAG: 4Fe-4S dicluster domain-containing protein [Gemmatimonadota bacterium]